MQSTSVHFKQNLNELNFNARESHVAYTCSMSCISKAESMMDIFNWRAFVWAFNL